MIDDKWRTYTCTLCRGYGMIWVGDAAWDGIAECDCGNGTIYIRPTGHTFAWPGGPANGRDTKEQYEKATPYLPTCEHGVIFVNDANCQECSNEFIKEFGSTWQEEEGAAKNMARRERYAQKRK